jgi:hypothetical protein
MDKLNEHARINKDKDLNGTKFTIHIEGGAGTTGRSEHGDPHMEIKCSGVSYFIYIPTQEEWNTRTIRAYVTTSKKNIITSKIKNEVIVWFNQKSSDTTHLTNIEYSRFRWNIMNEYNTVPNIVLFDSIYNIGNDISNIFDTEYGDFEIITNKPNFKKVKLNNIEYTTTDNKIWYDIEYNMVEDELNDLFNMKTKL